MPLVRDCLFFVGVNKMAKSEIELAQRLDKVAHTSRTIGASNQDMLDTRNTMVVCRKIWMHHTASGTGETVYVTLTGADATASTGFTLSNNSILLDGIDFAGEIKARGSAATQHLAIVCFGRS